MPKQASRAGELGIPSRSFAEIYQTAFASWQVGDFRAALEFLDLSRPLKVQESADKGLLRARCLLRLGMFDDALKAATILIEALDKDRVATAFLLQASALSRNELLVEAGERVNRAASVGSVDRTILAEILLERSFIEYCLRNLVEARRLAVEAVGRADDIVLARAQEMFGFINIAEEKFEEAARSFSQALATLKTSRHRDYMLEAKIFCAAVSMAADRLDTSAMADFDGSFERLKWTSDMRRLQFQANQTLGWLHLIAGDESFAWSKFHEAIDVLPKDQVALRVMGFTNFASIHRFVGEAFAGGQFVNVASSLARIASWKDELPDGRAALVELLIEAVRSGQTVPSSVLKDYELVPTGAGGSSFDKGDRRMLALVLTARGLVIGQSNATRGMALLNEALEISVSIGYRMRAAQIALDLYGLSNNPEFLQFAMDQTSGNRRGFLRNLLTAAVKRENRGIQDLTRGERKVLIATLKGKSTAAIAEDTGLAVKTVKNRTLEIFKKMSVSSRAELIVACKDLDIEPDSR